MEVPTFQGDIMTYASFLKPSQIMYDRLPIPASEKLSHLKQHILRYPHTIIKNLDLTDANYERAIMELNLQYDCPN